MSEDKAKRFNKGKARMHYLGYFYLGLEKLCAVCDFGESKYDKGNFMRGKEQRASEYFDAALRHILKGVCNNRDVESKEYHAAHAIWNLLEYLSRECSGTLVDDMKERVPIERVASSERVNKIELLNAWHERNKDEDRS